jgi:diaminopimelate epimerase
MANFAYMSGTGNNFLVGQYDGSVSAIQIVALVSDAEIEVDGVIFVEPIDDSKVKMHYFNNDGSKAELCVNGVRCVAKYSIDNGFVKSNDFIVNAPVSDIKVSVQDNNVEIQAPIPTFEEESILFDNYEGIKAKVGNPHFMVEVDDVENTNLISLNNSIKSLDLFKDGYNLEIYEIIDNKYIKARVLERGVGETDACGSGALCLFNYLYKTKKILNNSYVLYPGGDLNLKFQDEVLYLSGDVIYL